ncbi:UDP-glucose/GDP-mannose dehydrogenase family protein [Saccharopolyspora sp. NPDC050642]|uniref:UDP-glucose dehydrogenase family protein n=1 Tax=Saccharopolyspora sp. NPDC050642 TaxID=3157099 RepID=UPI00340FC0BB
MSEIAVIGAGYVGLASAVGFAAIGHRVTCADVDRAKVAELRRGRTGILEPGMPESLSESLAAGRLRFTSDARAAVREAKFVFLCLPTPTGDDGAADTGIVLSVVDDVRDALRMAAVLVVKSTVPAGTTDLLQARVGRRDIRVVANPEFLREGRALADFLRPERVVIGADDTCSARRVAALYEPLNAPVVRTDPRSAEMIKYASNCFLATKLSFINSISDICAAIGADVDDVALGMGLDSRIGPDFLRPGPGWGGSCLPKDTKALAWLADRAGVDFPVLTAAVASNTRRQAAIVERIGELLGGRLSGARIAAFGLAFKAGTGDLRESPGIKVAEALARAGAHVRGYDPGVTATARIPGVPVVDDPYSAAEGCDLIAVFTEWPDFRELDWMQVAGRCRATAVFDTRRVLDPLVLNKAGLECVHP